MTVNIQQPVTLGVKALMSKDQYLIPIYQRNYAWGDTEIELLLTDIYQAFMRNKEKNYYIGSLVVSKNQQYFEVIDGQQRLTTFTLLMGFLRHKFSYLDLPKCKNIGFEYRESSNQVLNQVFTLQDFSKINDFDQHFKMALKSIEKHWGDKEQDFAEFLLNQVQIIRTEVPPQTDLNHYFEIMNTRGEQLEKHEILKSRLMSKLSTNHAEKNESQSLASEQIAFAKIWEACSDMSRYVVMGFDANIRANEVLFGENWDKMPCDNFDNIAKLFQEQPSNDDKKKYWTSLMLMAFLWKIKIK
ncbi:MULTISPECIES: DUF262 domain-containing protein [unclassified Acinetobacter]|uniref:DUF262 domain-containing protein n=1 Tax=unclassified Acinetobacter TaxID=196816 RepID=UPI0035B9A010